MKDISIYELRDLVAAKVGISCRAENFQDLKAFIEEIYSQFDLDWECLDDQAYYSHNATCHDRHITGKVSLIKSAYGEMDGSLSLTDGDADFVVETEDSVEEIGSLSEAQTGNLEVSYVDGDGISVLKTASILREIVKKYNENEVVTLNIGELGKEEGYCDLHLAWKIFADKIESDDCYLEIKDDGGAKLMDALYWLCDCFFGDSFEDFEKLGVALRYSAEEGKDE